MEAVCTKLGIIRDRSTSPQPNPLEEESVIKVWSRMHEDEVKYLTSKSLTYAFH
jgi:hypothetical protein